MAIVSHNTNATPWKARPLSANEAAQHTGYNYIATITANDLTTAAATAQTYTLITLKPGDIVEGTAWRLRTSFLSATSGSLAIEIGRTGSVALWQASAVIDEEGTEIVVHVSDETVPVAYPAASDIIATITPTTATMLSFTRGQIDIYIKLFRTPSLSNNDVVITK